MFHSSVFKSDLFLCHASAVGILKQPCDDQWLHFVFILHHFENLKVNIGIPMPILLGNIPLSEANRRFHKELGLVLSRVRIRNSSYIGLILRSACYSARLGLVLSPKISLKLGRVLWNRRHVFHCLVGRLAFKEISKINKLELIQKKQVSVLDPFPNHASAVGIVKNTLCWQCSAPPCVYRNASTSK